MGWKIPVAKPDIGQEEVEAVTEVVKSGWITQRDRVKEFEKQFSRFCGAEYGIATSSGTSAIHMALMAIGLSQGDEVITTPLSCIATANPILLQGARPVFVDIEKLTYNMDVSLIEEKITPKTKAILPVHLFGHPVDMDPLMEIARKHGLWVIEDAAQAHGTEYKGRRAGSIGHIGCFSLYANKIITTGEGGIAVTSSPDLMEKMIAIRNLGEHKTKNFIYPVVGFNYKMTDMQAGVGLAQMNRIDEFIRQRRANVAELNQRLKTLPGIKSLPAELAYAKSVYFSYYIEMLTGELRTKTQNYLEDNGIETRPFFCVIPDQSPYREMGYSIEDIPNTTSAFDRGFYITNSPGLSKEDKDFIVKIISMVLTGSVEQ